MRPQKEVNIGEDMSKSTEITDDLLKVMTAALLELQILVNKDVYQESDFSSIVKVFLLGVISTAIDLVELTSPGSAPFLYADIEAAAKHGGIRAITKMQLENGSASYSVSNIAPGDLETAMNYLGKELSTALYKGLHELPMSLRSSEVLLRGIEALVGNLLNQKFNNPHQTLDEFCDHIHMALNDLDPRNNKNIIYIKNFKS